jgi:hypothetical protein
MSQFCRGTRPKVPAEAGFLGYGGSFATESVNAWGQVAPDVNAVFTMIRLDQDLMELRPEMSR